MLYTLRAGRINTLLFMAPDIPVFKIQSDLLPRFRNTPFNYFQSFYPITKRNEKLLSPSSKTPIRTINRDESTRSKRERQLFHTKTRSYRDQAYLANKNKEEEEKKEKNKKCTLTSTRSLLQFWSAYVPCSSQHLDSVQLALEQIDLIRRLVNKHPESMVLVTTAEGETFSLAIPLLCNGNHRFKKIQCRYLVVRLHATVSFCREREGKKKRKEKRRGGRRVDRESVDVANRLVVSFFFSTRPI